MPCMLKYSKKEMRDAAKRNESQYSPKRRYHAGLEEGKAQGYAEYHVLIEEARQIIAAAKKENITYLEASEKTILDLAVKIAGKIVASKIDEEENSYLTFVKRAVKEAKEYP